MKRKLFAFVVCTSLLFNLVVVKASDTASNSGYGCTLTGSVYDHYITARVTGTSSSYYSVTLKNAYYYDTAGRLIRQIIHQV